MTVVLAVLQYTLHQPKGDTVMDLLFARVPWSIPSLLELCRRYNRLNNEYTQAARRLGDGPYHIWLDDGPTEVNVMALKFMRGITYDQALDYCWMIWGLRQYQPEGEADRDWDAVVGCYLSTMLERPPR